jgi:hypothetical protein
MEIEIHSGVDEESETSDEGTGVIGEALRISLCAENFPARPKQEQDKSKTTQPADDAAFRERLGVIVVTVIYD